MHSKELSIQQKRTESLYERETRKIVYKITKEESLRFFPISYFKIDKKFQMIKIYVCLEEDCQNQEIINLFNRKHVKTIKRYLIQTKKFRRIPEIIFLFDKELNNINKIEKIVKEIN